MKSSQQKKRIKATLWGVGKKIDLIIIDYREAQGGFKAPGDIKLADGDRR